MNSGSPTTWDLPPRNPRPTSDSAGSISIPAGVSARPLAAYYRLFPAAFQRRISDQGLWMPFARISQVKNWQDFGFRFKEGNDETAWDDAHGIITFRYTEPMTWWMPMPKSMAANPGGGPERGQTPGRSRPAQGQALSPAATTTRTARSRPSSATSPGTMAPSGA